MSDEAVVHLFIDDDFGRCRKHTIARGELPRQRGQDAHAFIYYRLTLRSIA